MEKKMVFFDVDATLADRSMNVSVAVAESLRKLKENGTEIALATGRAPSVVQELMRRHGIENIVAFNGQYVKGKEGMIYSEPFDLPNMTRLVNESVQNDHSMVFLSENERWANAEKDWRIEKAVVDTLHFPYPKVDKEYYQKHDIYQIWLFCEEGQEKIYEAEREHFDFVRWGDTVLDVLQIPSSKAFGIEKMIEYYGIKRENVYAFGDDFNDIEMLEYVGTGIAMGQAPEGVKRKADMVTDDFNHDGVAVALQKLGLI